MHTDASDTRLHWDIFCHVIDNLGDLGVCWRLASNLAARGQQVRLWIDQPQALAWMAPDGTPGVQVVPWQEPLSAQDLVPGDVLVEAFGCEVPDAFVAAYARSLVDSGSPSRWINLEYLSAEAYVERCHRLPSPVMSGPGRGLTKHFFYPGFTVRTGGLLREPGLIERRNRFDRAAWLARQGIDWHGERLVALFCYEPAALERLLTTLASDAQATRLLVTAGRAQAAVRHGVGRLDTSDPGWNARHRLKIVDLPLLPQDEFDHLLWACDLNFVRGEDSLVRALWAGHAFVWQLYPQHDDAHHGKLEAFLGWLQAPASLRNVHRQWNGQETAPCTGLDAPSWLSALDDWHACTRAARDHLLAQRDLASALLEFVAKTD